jgi:hypothetical protein
MAFLLASSSPRRSRTILATAFGSGGPEASIRASAKAFADA